MLMPCGWYASVNAISASRVNRINSVNSSAVAAANEPTWRFGTTIRWPLL